MANFYKNSPLEGINWRFIGKNILIALAIFIVILIILIIWLRHYTEHGQEVQVPQLVGMKVEDADTLLAKDRLLLQVIDSTFSRAVPLGTIVDQNPPAFSHVKHDRAIYIVVNARTRKHVILPELHDISYRQAENMLRQIGLQVGEVSYEPSEYRDLVIGVMHHGENIENGIQLEEGSVVDLVVGIGQGTEMVFVPELRGMTLTQARATLLGQHLTMGAPNYDEQPNEEQDQEFVIYSQDPLPDKSIREGSSVKVWLSTDPEKAIIADTHEDEEEFF